MWGNLGRILYLSWIYCGYTSGTNTKHGYCIYFVKPFGRCPSSVLTCCHFPLHELSFHLKLPRLCCRLLTDYELIFMVTHTCAHADSIPAIFTMSHGAVRRPCMKTFNHLQVNELGIRRHSGHFHHILCPN